SPVRANLESLVGTVVTGVATGAGITEDRALCAEQARRSEEGIEASRFDVAFPVNRRTLSFDGLTTRRLFTPRNFACLDFLASAFHAIDDPRGREAGGVLL